MRAFSTRYAWFAAWRTGSAIAGTAFVFFSLVEVSSADVRLPSLFTEHMVLQRETVLPVWGWADPGEAVTVSLAGTSRSAQADDQGAWRIVLDPLPAGGPYELQVQGRNRIDLKDVLIGEVWLCSGQSNMVWPIRLSANSKEEISGSADSRIRLFSVTPVSSEKPARDVQGQWRVCGPDTVLDFSAVAYFFGRHLRRELNVPVGLICSAVGGTPAESWTREEDLAADPELHRIVEDKARALDAYPAANVRYKDELRAFEAIGGYDPATRMDETGWEKVDFDDGAWGVIQQPMAWESTGIAELNLDGTLWCRRVVDIPESWSGKDLIFQSGPMDEADQTYFNGELIGETHRWMASRTYSIPGRLVQPGRAGIAIRVTDRGGAGGITCDAGDFRLERFGAPDQLIPLAGSWRYRISGRFLPKPIAPVGPGHVLFPSGLYNGMIAPLIPYGIRGVIWYQGESNTDYAMEYRRLFPTLIHGWRKIWGKGEFPFLWVQLANYTWWGNEQPGESKWAELREAQTRTLSLTNTGETVAIDIGEARDIHPKNKQEVGRRLALIALDRTYQHATVCSGPMFRDLRIQKGRAVLSFDHADGNLIARGGPLRQFAIAGPDRKFVWAEAVISNHTVVVSSAQVPEPVAVRYAWADNPEGCNLYNGADLPASPFRTDDWPVGGK